MYDRCFSTKAYARSVRVYHWCASSIYDTPQYRSHSTRVRLWCMRNERKNKNTQCTSVSLVHELNQRHTAIQITQHTSVSLVYAVRQPLSTQVCN